MVVEHEALSLLLRITGLHLVTYYYRSRQGGCLAVRIGRRVVEVYYSQFLLVVVNLARDGRLNGFLRCLDVAVFTARSECCLHCAACEDGGKHP